MALKVAVCRLGGTRWEPWEISVHTYYVRTMPVNILSQYKAVKAAYSAVKNALPLAGGTMTGEIKTTSMNHLRTIQGGYGGFWRQDGANLYYYADE